MRDAYIPPNSLVLIELNTALYNAVTRDQIAEYIKVKFKATPIIVAAHETPTSINVMMPTD